MSAATKITLNCLRCSDAMEKGNLFPVEPAVPLSWFISETEAEAVKGFRILRGAEGKRISEALSRVKESRARVLAFRCPTCGYVELNAQRD
jgi:rubrerythrin